MLTPTVFELKFEPSSPLIFKSGQFISIVIPGAGPKGRDLRRAYSIGSAPDKDPVELCIKIVDGGPGTTYLKQLRPGHSFRGYAPYGDFTHVTPPTHHSCYIATGTGIAPFRSMVLSKDYRENNPKTGYILFGSRDENEILYENELSNLPNMNWISAVSRPTSDCKGFKGRVTDWLRSQSDFPWLDTYYYLCGSSAMIDEVNQILTEKGVQKECIRKEVYYKTQPDHA